MPRIVEKFHIISNTGQVYGVSIVDICVDRILKRVPLATADGDLTGGIKLPPHLGEWFEISNITPAVVEEEGEELLGHYEPMASPGRLVLHCDELTAFFWHQAQDVFQTGYYLEQKDLRFLCHMVVMKTFTHEQFHHFCDVARPLFGGHYDRLKEEALAVAWSYFQLEELRSAWQSKEARLSAGIYRYVLPRLFCYRGAGYRDWVNYQRRADFEAELIRYTGPASSMTLECNGVNMSSVLVNILETTKLQAVQEDIK